MKKEGRNSDSQLPEGVGAAISHKDGTTTFILDPYLKEMKWEGVGVDSEKFKDLLPHERLFRLACEFLGAAIFLCERAGEAGLALTWPQGSVVFYCLHLATELFLKACLIREKVPSKALGHEVADLLQEYDRAFTEDVYHFSTPWQVSARDINQALGFDALTGVDCVSDQLFRYSMNKAGTPSKGIQVFTPGYIYNYMKDLEHKWSKIWSLLDEKSTG
jgi:hypothetical protein